MSDFDTLLERLLVEQHALLTTNVSTDTGSAAHVEERISKAGMFGLFTAVTEALAGAARADLGGLDTSLAEGRAPADAALGGPDTAPEDSVAADGGRAAAR